MLLLVLGSVLACSGCGKKTEPPPSSATQPVATVPQSASPAPAPPLTFTFTGEQATQQFNLQAGLWLFNVRYAGSDEISVELLNQSGAQVTMLADLTGPINGSVAYGVPAGTYSLNVHATGNWTVDLVMDTPISVPFIPQVFSGPGLQATEFFQSGGGQASFTMSHEGAGEFTVVLLKSTGENLHTLVNTTGAFSGGEQFPLETNNYYLLNVTATSPWTITVE